MLKTLMYTPAPFREESLETLHRLIREHSFAVLVGRWEGRPFATHVPLLLDAGRGPYGTLRGHVARANPHWEGMQAGEQTGEQALAIFQGPHAYVSPSWYETTLSVPTWNYLAVHAYGVPRLTWDAAAVRVLLQDMVREYESAFERPWEMALPEEFVEKLTPAIVAFEMEITRIEGKLKLSQNRPEADRLGALAALREAVDPASRAVGEWMARLEEARRSGRRDAG